MVTRTQRETEASVTRRQKPSLVSEESQTLVSSRTNTRQVENLILGEFRFVLHDPVHMPPQILQPFFLQPVENFLALLRGKGFHFLDNISRVHGGDNIISSSERKPTFAKEVA